jgi:hypothetical protein
MKRLTVILISIISLGIPQAHALHGDIRASLRFFDEQQTTFKVGWQNQLESAALHHYYVSGGSEEADFSVGYFQMKPSFIESLECDIVESEELSRQFAHLLPAGHWTEEQARRFRLDNLNHIASQFHYLCAYHAIMRHRYQSDCLDDTPKRLGFFASAYNFGYTHPENRIRHWMTVGAFPYGRRFNFPQDSYADVSVAIYEAIKTSSCMD